MLYGRVVIPCRVLYTHKHEHKLLTNRYACIIVGRI